MHLQIGVIVLPRLIQMDEEKDVGPHIVIIFHVVRKPLEPKKN